MQDGTNGGRTQETAAWLLRNMRERQVQSFAYPTGVGGSLVGAELVRQWKIRNPEDEAVAISYVGQLAEQWKRSGVEAITRLHADRELREHGTVLDHAPERIGLVLVDGPPDDRSRHLPFILGRLPRATVLLMESGRGVLR